MLVGTRMQDLIDQLVCALVKPLLEIVESRWPAPPK